MPDFGGPTTSVLVVDDNQLDCELVRAILNRSKKMEYRLDWEPQCKQAVEKMATNRHDVYVIDFRLGEMTGVEAIAEARRKGCHGPVILLTGSDFPEVDIDAALAGADDYLSKNDLRLDTLERVIRYAIERKRNEKLITQHQMRLAHALKLSTLGEMAGGIAHEINNPLAVIVGRANQVRTMIEEGDLDVAKAMDALERVESMTNRIIKIVRGLRSFGRNSQNDPFERTRLATIVEDSVSLCQAKLNSADAKLTVLQENPMLEIECREAEISQILINLLTNAADALEEKSEKWICLMIKDRKDRVEIRVRDSGPGVPEELKEQILQPFFSTKPKGKGTGLGLSISQKIVKRHRGEFSLNENCENTEFVVTLPKKQSQVEKIRKPVVMVADDEEEIRDLVSEEFERAGCRVFRARDGFEALEIFSDNSVDLIVTDIKMPGYSGVELFRKIHHRTGIRCPKVVFITAYDDVDIPSYRDQEVAVFRKPFDCRDLVHTLIEEDSPQTDSLAAAA